MRRELVVAMVFKHGPSLPPGRGGCHWSW
jgi:hypothetical protein